MKYFSLVLIVLCIFLSGCYSFTGGSLPDYFETLNIQNIKDNSSYANPQFKELFQEYLNEKFSRDGTLSLTNKKGDCQLIITIQSIQESPVALNTNELETERKITVTVVAEFIDNVNKKTLWKKNFSQYGIYQITAAQAGRNDAVDEGLKLISEEILFSVVSGW